MKRIIGIVLGTVAAALLAVGAAHVMAADNEAGWPAAAGQTWMKQTTDKPLDTAKIDKLTGLTGAYDENEHAYRVSEGRGELRVVADGVRITPELGLTSWASFIPAGSQTMVEGNFILLEGEVNLALDKAAENGLNVVALHNAFLWDTPRIMTMHVEATGDQTQLATAIGKVFAELRNSHINPNAEPSTKVSIDPAKTDLDTSALAAALHQPGTLNNGVYRTVIPREVTVDGKQFSSAMGVASWASFVGTRSRAAVEGALAVQPTEFLSVLRALRGSEIKIVAIDQHMTADEPRILFLRFQGTGSSDSLAKPLRAALDQTRSMMVGMR
jgi:hypothetical protein